MTDPFANLIQQQYVREQRSDDPFDRLMIDELNKTNPVTGEYIPEQPEIYKSFASRIAKLPLDIGKGFLESINIAPEMFGGEPISLRKRAARAFNLLTLPLPLTAPFKVAKFAPIGIRALSAGAGTAAIGGISAAIEGAPIIQRATGAGIVGAGLETALTMLTRRRLGSGIFRNASIFADPAKTPFHQADWAVVSAQKTDLAKLSTAGNAVKHAELAEDLTRTGYDPVEINGFGPNAGAPELGYVVNGMKTNEAVELARRYNQKGVLTSDGYVDLEKELLYPIDRASTKFDTNVDPTKDFFTEVDINGQLRRISLKFGTPVPINSRNLGYRTKVVQYSPDDPRVNDAIPAAAKLRLALTKVVKSTLGMEHFEDEIGAARFADPEELPSILARWDTSGLAEDAIKFGGVHSLADRTTPVFAKSLANLLKPIKGNELERFEDYLIFRRAKALDDLGTVKNGPKLSPAERLAADQFINDADVNFPHFNNVAKDVYDWRNAQLEWLVDADVYTRAEVDWIKLNSPDYVPFRDVALAKSTTDQMYEPGELFFVSQPLERLRNLDLRHKAPPLESMMRETFEWARVAKRGQVSSAFLKMLDELGEELSNTIAPVIGRRTGVQPAIDDELSEVLSNLRPPRKGLRQPMVISGLVDALDEAGRPIKERVWREIRDPAIAEMFYTLNPPELGLVTKLMKGFAGILRTGATLSLEFLARNPMRDVLFGKVTSGAFIRDFLPGVASAFKMDDAFQAANRAGVFRSELIAEDILQASNVIKHMTGAPLTAGERFMEIVKSPLELLQTLSLGMERGTRVGRFNRVLEDSLKAGMPIDRATLTAALAGRDVSVDFGVYGSRTTAIRLITAFWNAQIQGYRRLGEAFMQNPVGVATRAFGYITVPSVLLYLHNRNDPEYFQLPSWERTIFWHVKVGDRWLRIPKPFELGVVFGSSVERMLEAVDKTDQSRVDEFATEYIKRVASDVVPVPTATRPFVENILNHSLLRNRPIVSAALRDVAPEFQVQPGTSRVAEELGRMFNVSPVKIDNVFYGYTAGLGRFGTSLAGGAIDLGEAMFSSEKQLKDLKPSFDPRDLPGIRGLVSQFPRNAEPIDKLYSFADKARESVETADMLERTLRIDDLLDWVEKRAYLIGANQQLTPILSTLAQLRAQRSRIMEDKSMSPFEKRKLFDEYDRQMLEIAASAYDAFKLLDQPQE